MEEVKVIGQGQRFDLCLQGGSEIGGHGTTGYLGSRSLLEGLSVGCGGAEYYETM